MRRRSRRWWRRWIRASEPAAAPRNRRRQRMTSGSPRCSTTSQIQTPRPRSSAPTSSTSCAITNQSAGVSMASAEKGSPHHDDDSLPTSEPRSRRVRTAMRTGRPGQSDRRRDGANRHASARLLTQPDRRVLGAAGHAQPGRDRVAADHDLARRFPHHFKPRGTRLAALRAAAAACSSRLEPGAGRLTLAPAVQRELQQRKRVLAEIASSEATRGVVREYKPWLLLPEKPLGEITYENCGVVLRDTPPSQAQVT